MNYNSTCEGTPLDFYSSVRTPIVTYTVFKLWHAVRRIFLETTPTLVLKHFTESWLRCLQALLTDSPFDK